MSTFMRCGYECLEDVVSTLLRRRLKIGTIVVVQTHGRSGHYNPHLHIIMTSGGTNGAIIDIEIAMQNLKEEMSMGSCLVSGVRIVISGNREIMKFAVDSEPARRALSSF